MKIIIQSFHLEALTLFVALNCYGLTLAYGSYDCKGEKNSQIYYKSYQNSLHSWSDITMAGKNIHTTKCICSNEQCTVEGSTRNLAWSIQLAGSDSFSRFKFNHSIMLLNNRGFFKLPEI